MVTSSLKTDHLRMLNFITSSLPKFLGKKTLTLCSHIYLIMPELCCTTPLVTQICTAPVVPALSQCSRLQRCLFSSCAAFYLVTAGQSLKHRTRAEFSPTIDRLVSTTQSFYINNLQFNAMLYFLGFVCYIQHSDNMNSTCSLLARKNTCLEKHIFLIKISIVTRLKTFLCLVQKQ